MTAVAVTYTFVANTTASSGEVNENFSNLVNFLNNLNSGAATWDALRVTTSTTVVGILNNSTGTSNILNLQDNGTNVLTVADGGTTTITATNGGSSKALVVNNGTSTGNILEVQDNGSAVFTVADGAGVTATGAITITPTTNQLVLGTTRTVTITAPTPAASSRTHTIPDVSGDASFLMTLGAQTVTGAKTIASSALLLQEAGGTDVVTIAVAALGAGRTYTIPEVSGAADFVMTAGAQTIGGTKSYTAQMLQANGAVGAPSYSFTNNSDMGLYRIGADILGFAVTGGEGARITGGEFQFALPIRAQSGTVGSPGISFTSQSDAGWSRTGSDQVSMSIQGVEVYRVTGSAHSFRVIPARTLAGTVTDCGWGFNDDAGMGLFRQGSGVMSLAAGGVEAIRVDASSTATQTRLLVFDVDNNAMERVTVGAADSGGVGFKVLRIPN